VVQQAFHIDLPGRMAIFLILDEAVVLFHGLVLQSLLLVVCIDYAGVQADSIIAALPEIIGWMPAL
jgi:hypothetical protein